jgi:peroxiredoxin
VELPRLETLWRSYGDKGLSVVAVEALRDRERAMKFIDENKLTFHLLENDEAKNVVRDTYGVHGFPTSFVIDRDGKIVYCHLGFEKGDEAELEREIKEISARGVPDPAAAGHAVTRH